jgi:hypothetical protein
MRTIQSPGVEIREFDLTSRLATFAGTDVFVTGFADKGPTDEVIRPSSLREFEAIYGVPKTAAERYFYYSVDPLIRAGANVYVSRMPYGASTGEGFGSYYGALVYPVVAVTQDNTALSTNLNQTSGTYVLGQPKAFSLTKSQYLACLDGTGFTWNATGLSGVGESVIINASSTTLSSSVSFNSVSSFGCAGLVILNKGQTTVNPRFEGYYVGIADNTNFNPATPYNSIRSVKVLTTSADNTGTSLSTNLPANRINFALSGSNTSSGTVSEVMEGLAGFDISDSNYSDILNVGVFKLRQSIFTPDTIKLDYVLEDSAAGSISYGRQIGDPNGGSPLPFFIEDRINPISRNVTVLVNDYINNRTTGNTEGLNSSGIPLKKIRVYNNSLVETLTPSTSASFGINSALKNSLSGLGVADNLNPIGAYSDETFTNKDLGSIPLKLDRILDLVRNDEIYNIDVSVEAGLGTIYAASKALGTSTFDDTATGTGLAAGLAALQTTGTYSAPADPSDLRGSYNTIFSKFQTFAELERKDHLFIADPLRHIFVTGNNNKTIKDSSKNWSQHIFSALRHQFSLANSSYATTYANWARVNDKFSGRDIWVPFSGIAASIMTTTDTNNDPWWAPAGFTRGRVFGVNDIAVEPNQKQRDDLYKFSLNPITAFREGITVFGQKTLQKMPGAFDRINVRRLFLYLEKVTKATCRYYVFEPNSIFTRTRVKDDLRPLFERAKNNEGVYDYIIVCDERNNTPDVIDQNELIIDIYLKPVRAAEFILVNFYASRTGADFQELIG